MDIEEILKKTKLFEGIKYPEKLFSPSDMELKRYASGETIASTFEKCTHLSIIITGSVEIQNIYPSGKVSSLKKLGSFDLFGESIIPGHTHSYPSDIVAIKNTEILSIRKAALIKAAERNTILLENYITLLSKKLLMMNEKIKMLSLETLKKKLCWFILDLYEKQNSIDLSVPYNQEEIANMLGSQRPSVSREISHMQKDGLIEYGRGSIKIKNLRMLKSMLR